MKVCCRCGQEKPSTTEFFHKYKKSKDGLYFACKECRKDETREYREHNKEKIKEVQKKYYEENRQSLLQKNAQWREANKERVSQLSKKYYTENKDSLLDYQRKYREHPVNNHRSFLQRLDKEWGLSESKYVEMFSAQKGECPICESPLISDTKRPVVDHNHTTGDIRGILCDGCNRAIGLLGDSEVSLQNALNYLKERGSYGKR